ncbi:uncharacterized protein THITE_2037951, partial [Thermothielavioides terrestris NRRL 8126]
VYIFIDNIIIFSDIVDKYTKYLETIFNLFKKNNISIALAKSYIVYPSIELLSFYINRFGLTNIEYYITTFRNFAFLNNLFALEQYISVFRFLRYLILYYA